MLREQLKPHIEEVTQQEVSRRTGIPQPNISAWLAGRRPMPMDRQVQIAAACGLDVRISLVRKQVRKS